MKISPITYDEVRGWMEGLETIVVDTNVCAECLLARYLKETYGIKQPWVEMGCEPPTHFYWYAYSVAPHEAKGGHPSGGYIIPEDHEVYVLIDAFDDVFREKRERILDIRRDFGGDRLPPYRVVVPVKEVLECADRYQAFYDEVEA